MDPRERIKPITYLKNKTAELVRDVSDSGRTVVITQNGEAKVAVMGVETYNLWRKALGLLKLAAHADADIEAGRTATHEEVFIAAEAALRRAEGDG